MEQHPMVLHGRVSVAYFWGFQGTQYAGLEVAEQGL